MSFVTATDNFRIMGKGTCHFTNLDNLLEQFWYINEMYTDALKSSEDLASVKHFCHDYGGRYIVRLPF